MFSFGAFFFVDEVEEADEGCHVVRIFVEYLSFVNNVNPVSFKRFVVKQYRTVCKKAAT